MLFKCEAQQLMRALPAHSSRSQSFSRFICAGVTWHYHSQPGMAQWCCQGTVPGSRLGTTEAVPLEFLAHLSPELLKSIVWLTGNNQHPVLQDSPKSVLPETIFQWDCMALLPAGPQTHLRTLVPTLSCTRNTEPSCKIQHNRHPNCEIGKESQQIKAKNCTIKFCENLQD